MTGFLSVFVDAWEQLRLQRVRVLMSLLGVALAVAALTASLALGNVMTRVQDDLSIRYGGPEATYALTLGQSDDAPDQRAAVEAFRSITARYGMTYATPVVRFSPEFDQQLMYSYAEGLAVDPSYFAMHGRSVVEGRLLTAQDAQRLAPAVLVTESLAAELGVVDLRRDPVVRLADGTEAIVVGVVADAQQFDSSLFTLPETYFDRLQSGADVGDDPWMTGYDGMELKIWVPEAEAQEFARRIVTDLRRDLGIPVSGYRTDAGAFADLGPDPAFITQLVLVAVSVAILALGALSLINIAVVTVRYRIREFGIRRAFGASQRRIFVGVIMESVVGTFVAGVVGVGIVTVLYRGPAGAMLASSMAMDGLPPFPVEAAVIGIVVSVATGAIAGLIPALIAVGSKVIDAIRF